MVARTRKEMRTLLDVSRRGHQGWRSVRPVPESRRRAGPARDSDGVDDSEVLRGMNGAAAAAPRLRARLARTCVQSRPTMTLAPGTHLGRYEIRQPLGAGGMGEVYL